MEMDSGQLHHNDKSTKEMFPMQTIPPDSPDISDMFGEPLGPPRVGNEYQVEILPTITGSDAEATFDVSQSFRMGLTIPVIWIEDELNKHKSEGAGSNTNPDDSVKENGSLRSENSRKIQHTSKKMRLQGKAEFLECGLGKREEFKSPCLVPGLSGDSWSDIEAESFLLGLYFFEKNLVLMKKFIESKEIGEILSFYYSKFYGSDGHRRWSVCRKMNKKKSMLGSKFFTGWRQQELLNRLVPLLWEESQILLVEASKKFEDGKLSLEEYVSTLKTTAGIRNLIKVVGIGKGKEDLTLITDPTKTHQSLLVRPEIPIGKACSSLSSQDIIKFLTGDFRLSKARANDLFWEAVWPRLLAGGWHSEQPKNRAFLGSRNSLVFLMPGIEKFSRRKLTKGDHYFDCITDVLNKVAAEPKILELEGEGEEIRRDPEATLDRDDRLDHGKSRYLKPRISTFNPNFLKFTIVDTSLARGEKPFSVRELRNLPFETESTSELSPLSRETEVDSDDSVDTSLEVQENTHSVKNAKAVFGISSSNQRMQINGLGSEKKVMENGQNGDTDTRNDKQPRRTIKHLLSRKENPGHSDFLAPLIKRRRLTACSKVETSRGTENFTVGPEFKQVESHGTLNSSNDSLAEVSAEEESCGILHGNGCRPTVSTNNIEKPHPRPLIDLNIAHIASDSENDEFCTMEVDHNQGKQPSDTNKVVKDSKGSRTSINDKASEKQPNMQPTRQSTRNRPLTTKALEAFASGFLSTNRKRKGTESRENRVSRPSRKARIRGNVGIVGSSEDNGVDGDSYSNLKMFNESIAENEKRAAQDLLGISKAAYPQEALDFKND